MPSPFPGMDPYLEKQGLWQDFHGAFLVSLRRALVPLVRQRYLVKIEQHVLIREEGLTGRRGFRPDVAVVGTGEVGEVRAAVDLLEAPVELFLPGPEMVRQRFLEIRDLKDRDLITVIELLSPSNKSLGADGEQYLAKRGEILNSQANLVEIDLLRGGAALPPEDRPACDYSVLVSRASRRPAAQFWPILLRDRLPTVPIPLRAEDGDVAVDLQVVLDQTYDEAGYGDYVHEEPPSPLCLRPTPPGPSGCSRPGDDRRHPAAPCL